MADYHHAHGIRLRAYSAQVCTLKMLVSSAPATSCAALWFRQGRHCVPVPDYSHSKPTSPGRQTCHIRVGVKSREYWLHRYAILRVFTRCMLPCVLLSIKIIGMTGAR